VVQSHLYPGHIMGVERYSTWRNECYMIVALDAITMKAETKAGEVVLEAAKKHGRVHRRVSCSDT
jgi:hypothetical protein